MQDPPSPCLVGMMSWKGPEIFAGFCSESKDLGRPPRRQPGSGDPCGGCRAESRQIDAMATPTGKVTVARVRRGTTKVPYPPAALPPCSRREQTGRSSLQCGRRAAAVDRLISRFRKEKTGSHWSGNRLDRGDLFLLWAVIVIVPISLSATPATACRVTCPHDFSAR